MPAPKTVPITMPAMAPPPRPPPVGGGDAGGGGYATTALSTSWTSGVPVTTTRLERNAAAAWGEYSVARRVDVKLRAAALEPRTIVLIRMPPPPCVRR